MAQKFNAKELHILIAQATALGWTDEVIHLEKSLNKIKEEI